MKLKLTGVRLGIAVAGLILVLGSSLTAMAMEMKYGSVSRFIANLAPKEQKIKVESPKETENSTITTVQETPSQPAPTETENAVQSNQSTGKKSKSTTSSSSSLSGSGNNSSSGSSSSESSGSSGGSSNSGSSNNSSSNNSGSGSGNSNSGSGGSSNATPTPAPTPAPSNIFGKYSAVSVEDIVNALDLVFDDSTNDFIDPGGGGPPQGVYSYAPIDQDNVYMGVRDGRLYIKISLAGTVPSGQETIGSDTIQSITFNIHFSKSSDPESSNECGGVETSTQMNLGLNATGQVFYTPWFSANCNNTEPYQSGHDWSFEKTGDGLAHTYNAGVGKSSLVYSYALSDLLGTINVGDSVKLDISSEAESNNWEHYSYDQNLTDNRRPNWVDWVVKEI